MAVSFMFFLLPSLLVSSVFATPTSVSVTLFYETLCPDCQNFIPNKLFSAYTDSKFDFASLFNDLILIPYGFAKVINPATHEYKCQHGNSECEGNKLHACAIKYITDTLAQLNYISCLEKRAHNNYNISAVKYPIDKCQDKIPDGLYSSILNCYNTDEGWELFDKNGKVTNSFFSDSKEAFVPYVSFNHKKNDSLALEATEDFRKVICLVTGVEDKACSDNAI